MDLTITTAESGLLEDDKFNNVLPVISESMQNIMNAFPLPTALLSQDKRIITLNNHFLSFFSCLNKDDLIGKKPADIFSCISAIDTIHDDHISDQCQNCNVKLKLLDGILINHEFTHKCNLTFVNATGHIDELYNMKVNTSPFTLDGEQFYLFSVTDISNDVRRRLLDKIFFHDILNKAGNIIGILDVLDLLGKDDDKSGELFESLKNTSQDLLNEIKYQRDLSAAENNELTPKFAAAKSLEILNTTKTEMVHSDVANKREIVIAASSVNLQIMTDEVLLHRVLLNMLKNALEATPSGGKVTMGCAMSENGMVRFWVHNDATIPIVIQKQLFNKSASTKGCGRGLGTFSMRLLGEKYLKGKVTFLSSPETGTQFMIDLPLSL